MILRRHLLYTSSSQLSSYCSSSWFGLRLPASITKQIMPLPDLHACMVNIIAIYQKSFNTFASRMTRKSLKNGLHILQRRPNSLCSVCVNLLFPLFLLSMHERALGRFSGWCIPCQIRSGISRRRGNGSGHTTAFRAGKFTSKKICTGQVVCVFSILKVHKREIF